MPPSGAGDRPPAGRTDESRAPWWWQLGQGRCARRTHARTPRNHTADAPLSREADRESLLQQRSSYHHKFQTEATTAELQPPRHTPTTDHRRPTTTNLARRSVSLLHSLYYTLSYTHPRQYQPPKPTTTQFIPILRTSTQLRVFNYDTSRLISNSKFR